MTWKVSRFGVIFDGRSARFETLVPLVILRAAQTILSTSLLQHLKSLRKSFFPNLKENLTQKRRFLGSFIFKLQKSPKVLNTHSFKRLWLDD
jgi:hypothetical protein